MKTVAIFIILPALLQAQSGDVKCHSDFTEDGIAINKQCQVSFELSSDNGCPVVTSDTPRFSSVGMKFYSKTNKKVEKVMEETRKASNPPDSNNCRFDGDLLVCNCGSDLCNKDRRIIWNTFVNTKFELSDVCRQKFIETAWEEIYVWPATETESILTSPTLVNCLDSNTITPVKGDSCVATFTVMPGTCYILGYPVLNAYNYTEENCISKNTVRITCYTDNCNGDVEVLTKQIADGFSVFGGGSNVECKKQLKQSLVTTVTTTVKPQTTTHQPTTTNEPSTVSSIQNKYKCDDETWKISVRPDTVPYCFKVVSDSRRKFHSMQNCMQYFNATLPIIQYSSDMDALGRKCDFFVNTYKEKWRTLSGTGVPIVDTSFLKWSTYIKRDWLEEEECNTVCGDEIRPRNCSYEASYVACMKEANLQLF